MSEKDQYKNILVTSDDHSGDSGGRPRIQKYADNKFRVNDRVYFSSGRGLLGPYLVSRVPSARNYTLCDPNDGTPIENGRVFGENELQWA
ncbi:hypothetical protein ANO14919_090250 [Xylariales sp. No.14919]|nr:hypothetical protein ANO14919_090250 [Xylariales sp. No.14919]